MPIHPPRFPQSAAQTCSRATRILLQHCPYPIRLAFVLGSGFQGVLDRVAAEVEIPYASLPGFRRPQVPGHDGRVVAARLEGVPALFLAGRSHYYEGASMDEVTFPIRVLAALGVRNLVLTNAAGAIHPRLRKGGFMLLKDHINLMGVSPLQGPCPAGLERFVDLSHAYDPVLATFMKRAARSIGLPLPQGVYLAVAGPQFETPAEIKAFARLGADAVGMSTVPETIVARQVGMNVVGLSCITNQAAGRQRGALSHEEVLEAGRRAGERAAALLKAFAGIYARAKGRSE